MATLAPIGWSNCVRDFFKSLFHNMVDAQPDYGIRVIAFLEYNG